RDALIALGLQRIEQERPLERHPAPGAHGFQTLELAVGQTTGFVQQAADERRLAVVDMAHDHDAHERPCCRCSGGGEGIGNQNIHRLFVSVLRKLEGSHQRYPETRRRSNTSSDSWSMARPERSGTLVASSSVMISSIVTACDAIGNVMSASPSER